MTRTKKVTAQELDAQIGYGKEIDTKAIVAKMKKPTKVSDKKATKKVSKTDKEVIKKRATKIAEKIKVEEPKKQVTKVHIELLKDGNLVVWVCYKIEGYVRAVWKTYPTANTEEAIKLAQRYIEKIETVKEAVE